MFVSHGDFTVLCFTVLSRIPEELKRLQGERAANGLDENVGHRRPRILLSVASKLKTGENHRPWISMHAGIQPPMEEVSGAVIMMENV